MGPLPRPHREAPHRRWFPRRRGSLLGPEWDRVEGPCRLFVSLVPVGLSMVQVVTWTGRVARQTVHPHALLPFLSGDSWRATMESFFKRSGKSEKGSPGGGPVVSDPSFAADYPTLNSFLSAGTWPDGEVRQLSSLVVFVEDGVYKACLSDKDAGNVLWASSRLWSEIALSLEARLTEDAPGWVRGRKFAKKS